MYKKNESIQDSICKLSIDNNYDELSISMNALKVIWDRNYVHLENSTRDATLKIRDRNR